MKDNPDRQAAINRESLAIAEEGVSTPREIDQL